MKKKLVAYFSASGVTASVAKSIACAISTDLFEIVPMKPYTKADLDWQNQNSRSSIEMKDPKSRPEIMNRVDSIEEYDIIFIGFPIWWYIAPTIINTFLESYDFTGKMIVPFATSGGSGMGQTNIRLQPSCPGAVLADGKVFKANSRKQDLSSWAGEHYK